jgi:hypothetical protein
LKLFKPNLNKEKIISFFLSILLHGILILLILLIKIEYPHEKKYDEYLFFNFIEIKPDANKTLEKKSAESIQEIELHNQKNDLLSINKNKENQITKTAVDSTSIKSIIDTASNKVKIFVPVSQLADSSYRSLTFAATLLDSFLVRHPEYSRYILEQQAKELVENKNIKRFSRLALEKRINEELDKYLKEYYPEGSEHEPNPYAGPGMQIPIDGLIDAIKKIFE